MIRPTKIDDVAELTALTAATGTFKPLDVQALGEVFDDFFEDRADIGSQCHTLEIDGRPAGFVFFAPDTIGTGVWEVWWIVVRKDLHGRGLGKTMLEFTESAMRAEGGRIVYVDTSSLPPYEATRQFYLRRGYEQEAVIHDYYADGDHKVIFRKRLRPASPRSK